MCDCSRRISVIVCSISLNITNFLEDFKRFNVIKRNCVSGESGLGKSTLISSLFRKTELIKQRSTNGKTGKIKKTQVIPNLFLLL